MWIRLILRKMIYNFGKKKFMVLTRKQNFHNQDIIEKLNNAKGDPEGEILSSKYSESHELTPLLKNQRILSNEYLLASFSF